MTPLYFGCGDTAGHYAWTSEGYRDGSRQWLLLLDGKLPPEDPEQTEGKSSLYHFNGFTVLAFWDRSVDSRRGSSSAFVLPGRLELSKAIDVSKSLFPWVWARIKFEVTL